MVYAENHIPAMDGHMAAAHVKQPVSGTSDRPAEGVTAAAEPDSPASSKVYQSIVMTSSKID
jgi:hypothetical protein